MSGPVAGAQPTIFTQEQIAAQTLTQAQAANATGLKGRLKKDAGATYCATNGTFSVWSMPTADEATTVPGEYIGTLAGAGYRQVTIETNPVGLV